MPKANSIFGHSEFIADVSGTPVRVVYDPNFLTLGVEDELVKLSTSGQASNREVCEYYARMFKHMDLQDDDGNDIPMTVDGLLSIPDAVLKPILQQTREHMRGNLTKNSEG